MAISNSVGATFMHHRKWIDEHLELTRRYFLRCGLAGAAAVAWAPTARFDLFALGLDRLTITKLRSRLGHRLLGRHSARLSLLRESLAQR